MADRTQEPCDEQLTNAYSRSVRRMDDAVDKLIGDETVLLYKGRRIPLSTVLRTDTQQVAENGTVVEVLRTYVSVQDRFVLPNIASLGKIVRQDPYAPSGKPKIEQFSIVGTHGMRHGRTMLVLKLDRGDKARPPTKLRTARENNAYRSSDTTGVLRTDR